MNLLLTEPKGVAGANDEIHLAHWGGTGRKTGDKQ